MPKPPLHSMERILFLALLHFSQMPEVTSHFLHVYFHAYYHFLFYYCCFSFNLLVQLHRSFKLSTCFAEIQTSVFPDNQGTYLLSNLRNLLKFLAFKYEIFPLKSANSLFLLCVFICICLIPEILPILEKYVLSASLMDFYC